MRQQAAQYDHRVWRLPTRRVGTQPFLLAQFRDPLSPNNPNFFGLTVPTSPLEGGTTPGDSGGPVFIQTAAGLVQIGERSAEDSIPSGHGRGQYGDISGLDTTQPIPRLARAE